MKKIYRVKSDRDFQQVYHHGRSTANRQLVIYTFEKSKQKHFRVGLSVGKKLGNAVVRNQIKRYLRQALFEVRHAIQPEIDFLLIARRDIVGKSFFEVKQSLIHVMKRAGVFDHQLLTQDTGGQNEVKS